MEKYNPYMTHGRYDCDPHYDVPEPPEEGMDDHYAARVYINMIRQSLDAVDAQLDTPSDALSSVEKMQSELQALRYHIWNSTHRSGERG